MELVRAAVAPIVLLFVLSTMLNVGLTQRPSTIVACLRHRAFVWKMVLANFVLAPALMLVLVRVVTIDPAVEAGLLVFALCAGAPFLIKLTQVAEHHVALGAAVMLLLMALTVVYVPVALPLLLEDVSVDAGVIARALLLQMILPTLAGMAAARWLPAVARRVHPWMARVAGLSLYALLGATILGYFRGMVKLSGTSALPVLLVFLAGALAAGYWAGSGKDHLEDVGALGTAQRNTAAGLLIATQNFDDRTVLVVLTVANTIGILLLILVAKRFRKDNAPTPGGSG